MFSVFDETLLLYCYILWTITLLNRRIRFSQSICIHLAFFLLCIVAWKGCCCRERSERFDAVRYVRSNLLLTTKHRDMST